LATTSAARRPARAWPATPRRGTSRGRSGADGWKTPFGQLLVEAELVDLVGAGQPAAQEGRAPATRSSQNVGSSRGFVDGHDTHFLVRRIWAAGAPRRPGWPPRAAPRPRCARAGSRRTPRRGPRSKPKLLDERVVSTTRPCTKRSSWSSEKSRGPMPRAKPPAPTCRLEHGTATRPARRTAWRAYRAAPARLKVPGGPRHRPVQDFQGVVDVDELQARVAAEDGRHGAPRSSG